ncbi:hypothetical protein LTR09_000842 [Extremus antarcticus]|uniref:Enoyl reductase (ER) domain-containing protein n=1 Tax=Extremus antarcticus TaxID=702011 RepID=A0AAJ0GHL8_9PEZI|nr:hypothetical protein LTR09_000842 [Extremus antarcticus]
MSSLPSQMKAITINGNTAKVSTIPVPKVRPTYLLAKVDSIALNPTDWKHISNKIAAPGGISGCDFSGTVVEVGSDVSKNLKPGDRIAATTHGANFSQPEDGCFAEYAVAKADLVVKLPDGLKMEAAATFPLGVSTVGQGLFQQALEMEVPEKGTGGEGKSVLIYGGSTATGSLGIQFAKLAGYKVLTTCSPHNNDFVKSLGAEAVYNYKDADCGKQIRKDTNDSLKLAWDTVGIDGAGQICADALSSDGTGAKYGFIVNGVEFPRKDVESSKLTFMYTIFNDAFMKGGRDMAASKEDFDFAKMFFELTEKLLAEGKLKTHPEQVGGGGLEGALKGMKEMQEGKVSGKKLVYRVAETPKDSQASVEL